MINTVILFKTELVWPTSFDKVATAEEVLVAKGKCNRYTCNVEPCIDRVIMVN